jgi:uncharacterized delta-60 repeat protein
MASFKNKNKKRNCEVELDSTYGLRIINFGGNGRDAAYDIVEVPRGYVLIGPVAMPNSVGTITPVFGSVMLDKITGQIIGPYGQVTTKFPGKPNGADVPVVALADGNKILLGGSANFGIFDPPTNTNNLLAAMAKYTSDGVLDPTFGTNAEGAFDGKGLVYQDLDPNGVNDEIFAMAFDCKKRIVATGFSNPGIVVGAGPPFNFGTLRTLPNGVFDVSFGVNGKVLTEFGPGSDDRANGVVITSDGKIIVGGRTKSQTTVLPTGPFFNFALAKFNDDGSVDPSFGKYVGQPIGNQAIYPGQVVQTIVPNADNRIIKMFMIRNRALDFDENCPVAQCGFLNAAFKFGQKFIAAGIASTTAIPGGPPATSSFVVARYDTNGKLDTSFGPNGDGTNVFNFLPNSFDELYGAFEDLCGNIYAVGSTAIAAGSGFPKSFAIARLTPKGLLDPDFGAQGRLVLEFPEITTGFVRSGVVSKDGSIAFSGEGVRVGQTTADFISFKFIPV